MIGEYLGSQNLASEIVSRPELPRGFAEWLAAVVAVEEREQTGRAALFRRHYLELMPAMREDQLAGKSEAERIFFAAPLDWERLPRLRSALDRLDRALAGAGVPAVSRAGATVGDLYRTTYFGGFMPLLYGYAADLAYFQRALEAAPLCAVVDRYLAAPLVHELSHLHRDRDLLTLHLDECVAGWLGVDALPEFAYPGAGEDNGLYASPWFAQVGLALARTLGPSTVIAAHAGRQPWPEALARNVVRLGWSEYLALRPLHLLSDNFHPEPWLKLIFLAHAGAPLDDFTLESLRKFDWAEIPPGDETAMDEAVVRDGLRAMCLRNFQIDRSFRVASRPPPQPIEIDLLQCKIMTAPGEDGFDPVPLAHWFPPPVAARLRDRGLALLMIELRSLDAIDDCARAILDGKEFAGGDFSIYLAPAAGTRTAG